MVFYKGQIVKLPTYFTAQRGKVTGTHSIFADGIDMYFVEIRIAQPGNRDDAFVLIDPEHLTPAPLHENTCPTCACEGTGAITYAAGPDPKDKAADLGG